MSSVSPSMPNLNQSASVESIFPSIHREESLQKSVGTSSMESKKSIFTDSQKMEI